MWNKDVQDSSIQIRRKKASGRTPEKGVLLYAVFISIEIRRKMARSRKVWAGVVVFLAVANVLVWEQVIWSGRSFIVFLDVGQGDSMFIHTRNGYQMLIDGGPDAGVLEALGRVMPFWDKSIDVVMLTHPDKDHVGGLLDVLSRYHVDTVVWTGVKKNSSEARLWERLAQNARQEIAFAPLRIQFSQNEYMDVLHPFRSVEGVEMKVVNDTSIVAKLRMGSVEVLFTGDISNAAEKEIVAARTDVSAGILKVPHHGSKTSSSSLFLEAVRPYLAIIEAGEGNSYGHPTEETLARLERYGIQVLRTDLAGDIRVVTN